MSNEPQAAKQMHINVEVPTELEATYANLALITHTASEMFLDFARMLPNSPKAKVHARVVMTPMNAKLLLRALGENLEKYEAKFGEVKTPEAVSHTDRTMGFAK